MHVLELTKPDGRRMTLYGRDPITGVAAAPTPHGERVTPDPHLRWHPLRGEWVAYATYRQDRTFLPPPDENPLEPTRDPAHPTELPQGRYDIAVFGNRFPALSLDARAAPPLPVETRPATGHCDVVVFTQDARASLGALPVDHIALLFEVWAHRTETLARDGRIRFVLPFENRGVEVGVTLHHPHGQLYAYPFVPPIPAQMQRMEREHQRLGRGTLLETMIDAELRCGSRLLYADARAVAFVPPCARYPYEVWIAPRARAAWFGELDVAARGALARALKTVLLKLDGLWNRPFPYVMAWYQAPTDGASHPESHLHAELYPAYRTREKLKYLAGTELAAGMFANDSLPEAKARELQAVDVVF